MLLWLFSITIFLYFPIFSLIFSSEMWPDMATASPPCHCKAITQTWLCVSEGLGGGLSIVALSCLPSSPVSSKLFEVTGAFLWEIKSITAGSERQRRATAGPFRLRAEEKTIFAAGDGRIISHTAATAAAASPVCAYRHILLLGLRLNAGWNQHTPSGLIRPVWF